MKKLLFAALILGQACGRNKDLKKPSVKPLMEAVYASGYVVSKDEYQVYAQAEGYVVDIVVQDGADVKKGDVIFIIESQQQNARYRIAREAYDMATTNNSQGSPVLNELKAAVASARTKAQYDSVNLVRYTNLLKLNATTNAEYDRIRLAYENSKNDLTLQVSRYEKGKNQVALDLKNAENQWKISSEESGRYSIRSDMDGRVYKTLKEKGELVRRSEAVATIGSKDSFYVQLSVDELDIQKVKEGQEVLVKIDAFADQVFHAAITQVHPLVDSREQSVRVDADFISPLLHGFSGLAVEANIVIRKKDKALVISKSNLLPGDSVLVHTANGNKKIKITRGIETLDEVEVASGLSAESELLVKK
jgi:HlyD family secretion protein